MIIFDKKAVSENLSMSNCIQLMEKTLVQYSEKQYTQYLRHIAPLQSGNVMAFMAADTTLGYFGSKVLSVYPNNSKDGYPSHQGQVLLFESEHGELCSISDATEITKIRTAAVSAVATKYLANPQSKILAILGTGEQAHSHLEALTTLYSFEKIHIYNRKLEKAQNFCHQYPKYHMIAFDNADEAVKEADIICTVTSSKVPLFAYSSLKKGAHINAVGSCNPKSREIDSETVKNSLFYCDDSASVLKESGDFLIPLHQNIITENHIQGTIAQVITRQIPSRTGSEDITVFESLGLAIEDIACAIELTRRAAK